MRIKVLCQLVLVFLFASTLSAETVIKVYDGPLPVRQPTQDSARQLPAAISTLDRVEEPTTFYILPAFKIDSLDPAGETTVIAVRNEDDVVNTVTIQLFRANTAQDPLTLMNTLEPKEIWTLNLRAVTGAIPPDFGGYIRGWGRILGGSGPITADYFQIDSAQDFATGGRPIDIGAGEFCKQATLRFLVGGGFTGVTLLTFMLDQPLGDDPETDPPSITGTIYFETSGMSGTFEIFTDEFSLEVNAARLVSHNFGSMDITYENIFSGGFATASYKADNRYSVGVKQVCLDSLTP